jgi:putative FmdB family regulatory protein
MPTYEYACKSCGEHLEVVQSFRDEALTECHLCGGELRKVFSPVGISFKGSGFYRNDSRSASKGAKREKAESSTTSDSPASKDSSSKDSSSKESNTKDSSAKKSASSEAKSA